MIDYRNPLRDMQFILWDVLDYAGHYARLPGIAPDRALLDTILVEMARFTEGELAPLYAPGDHEGCHFRDGRVTTPQGYRAAYAAFCAAGWPAIAGEVAHGGQGLPESVGMLLEEMLMAANIAFGMYPGLSHGAVHALEAHGSPEQQAKWLPKLVSGEWTGTMCLTEPHAGSDVGLLRTRAEPVGDGSYRITGTKIFISAGEHDLTDNIVHLVLARLPDAPAGTRGITLFLVPRNHVDGDGRCGARNGVTCGSIEDKMGLHANATCVLHFDGAIGWPIGAENAGMRSMFTMMNAARLAVGIQGLGLLERGYQASLAYAQERLQMRSLRGPQNPGGPADPLLVHPDIRRMLLTQKALGEGSRALLYHAGLLVDRVRRDTDAEAVAAARDELDFLTPVCKGFVTEVAYECVNHAVQVFGGHGFIRETGVEQLVRDCRITLIYEGTTQIQALDLLGRKTLATGGRALQRLAMQVAGTAAQLAADPALADLGAALAPWPQRWGEAALAVGGRAQQDPDEVGAAAVDFLMLSGYVLTAWMWGRMALAAEPLRAAGQDADLHAGRIAAARFGMLRLLPRAEAHAAAMRAGAASLMAIDAAAFDHV